MERNARVFRYQDQGGVHVITWGEIIEQYYPFWCAGMCSIGKQNQVSEQNCVDDFVVVHWAEEITHEKSGD